MDNAFTKLNDIYLKKKQISYYKLDLHDGFVVRAVGKLLRKEVDNYQPIKMGVADIFLYLLILHCLPIYWDYEIREELIRPIFIQTRLITKEDYYFSHNLK